ncbi:MAG: ATP-binding protein [Bacteroidales bacterium]|nr:ATP-binding protein [Bacteroidales bacterium]
MYKNTKPENQFSIAVASGKGGTGKTFVSVNLFHALEQTGLNIHLVDCDAEAPNDKMFFEARLSKQEEIFQQVPVINLQACTFCGRCYEYCHYNAIFFVPELKKISVLYDFCHGCGACTYACRDGAITERKDLLGEVNTYTLSKNSALFESRIKVGVHSSVPVLKAAIKAAREAEIILMDAPPGTSCPFIHTVAGADYVVLVTEPTPFGLSDLKQSVDTLASIGTPCGVVVNKAGLGDREVYAYLEEKQIPLLMDIPFDKGLAALYSGGKIPAREDPLWKEGFIELYRIIKEQYGNSSRQR